MSQPNQPKPSPGPDRRQQPRRRQDERLLQRDRALDAARRICDAISRQNHSDKLIEQALVVALEVVDAEAGSILLADPKARTLVFRHVVGEKAQLIRGLAIPWNKGLAGAVFMSGEAEVVADAKRDHRHYPDIDELTGFRTRDMIVLPLKQWGRPPIGVLEVMNKRRGQLDEADVDILTIVSALATTAIEQARLFEEAKVAELVHRLADIGHDVSNLLLPVSISGTILQTEIEWLCGNLRKTDAERARGSYKLCTEALETQRDAVRRIRDRLKEVTDCVKGLSSPPQFAPCRLADVVGSVVRTLGLLAKQQGVDLRLEGLDGLPELLADEQRLYNAFYNVVNNAVPEVPPGGSVTIRGHLEAPGGPICISVIDTGRGMPPEIRDSLFSGQAISRKVGGTGLGTKIVKDAVDAHGGQIAVESAEGRGTAFHIRLPLRPPGA
ncbi:GAF domain-containing sensor histidine kinase [Nitrospira sp. Kam-Ns4a]